MQEIHQGSMELEHDTIDVEDIEQSYEEGLDDDMYKAEEGAEGAVPPAPTAPAPAAPIPGVPAA